MAHARRCSSAPGLSVWPPSNKTFVPASEPHISIYAWFDVGLNSAHRGWIHFRVYSIFEPGPQSENACGFLQGLFEMLVEIITAVVLIQGCSILSQLIERRRDVLYYVSRPDPRW